MAATPSDQATSTVESKQSLPPTSEAGLAWPALGGLGEAHRQSPSPSTLGAGARLPGRAVARPPGAWLGRGGFAVTRAPSNTGLHASETCWLGDVVPMNYPYKEEIPQTPRTTLSRAVDRDRLLCSNLHPRPVDGCMTYARTGQLATRAQTRSINHSAVRPSETDRSCRRMTTVRGVGGLAGRRGVFDGPYQPPPSNFTRKLLHHIVGGRRRILSKLRGSSKLRELMVAVRPGAGWGARWCARNQDRPGSRDPGVRQSGNYHLKRRPRIRE